jgi:hypothetical protein
VKRVASVLISLSFLIAICPAMAADLLPGWAMYFIDFNSGKDLDLKVTQRSPDLEEPHPGGPGEFSDFRSATGVGCFAAGGMSGTLFVSQASWSNYGYYSGEDVGEYPDSGFPESAIATGLVRLGLFNWKTFRVELLSYEWPNPENKLDEAILYIPGKPVYTFTGELHHSRLRALFAPPRSDPRGTLATTWGKVRNTR